MTHGGKRTGSSRPQGSKSKKTLEQEALKDYIFSEVKSHAKEIVQALLEKGISGDIPAIREILDRSVGKVKNELEMRGNQDEPLVIKVISYADAGKQ